MKGVVFNILEELVLEKAGMTAWNNILDHAGSQGVYTAAESYDDAELMRVVASTCEIMQLPSEQVVGLFGEYLFSQLNSRYPMFTERCNNLKDFLMSVDSVIHIEVMKLYDNPHLPRFTCDDSSPGELLMQYRSPRKLCILAEGLVRGAATHYQEAIEIRHPVCMHDGHDHCDLVIELQ